MGVRAIIKTAVKKSAALAAIAGAFFFSASATFAQGCALCYSDAAATPPAAQAALRHGILILLFPPMILFAALYVFLYSRRPREVGSFAEDNDSASARNLGAHEVVLHLS
jgi:hypothetical protein